MSGRHQPEQGADSAAGLGTLCVCGHSSADHAQFDHGEYCFGCSCRDWRPIHKEAVDSSESTASLSAGVTPEGLAPETIAETVKVTPTRPSDAEEAAARAFADPCLYCGLDEDETPYEDTEEHRNTSEHQWTVYNS